MFSHEVGKWAVLSYEGNSFSEVVTEIDLLHDVGEYRINVLEKISDPFLGRNHQITFIIRY